MSAHPASALTREPGTEAAVADLVRDLGGAGAAPELLLLFATDAHAGALPEITRGLREGLGAGRVVACSGLGVLSEAGEVEEAPGLAALALPVEAPGLVLAVPGGAAAGSSAPSSAPAWRATSPRRPSFWRAPTPGGPRTSRPA